MRINTDCKRIKNNRKYGEAKIKHDNNNNNDR